MKMCTEVRTWKDRNNYKLLHGVATYTCHGYADASSCSSHFLIQSMLPWLRTVGIQGSSLSSKHLYLNVSRPSFCQLRHALVLTDCQAAEMLRTKFSDTMGTELVPMCTCPCENVLSRSHACKKCFSMT